MPHHDTFVLHVWHSHAVGGDQWAARLEHLPDGRSCHFDDPEGLLAYVRDLINISSVGRAASGDADERGDGR